MDAEKIKEYESYGCARDHHAHADSIEPIEDDGPRPQAAPPIGWSGDL